jgi:hypothetical protein
VDREPKTRPGVVVFMQCVFLVMLLGFGAGILRDGVRAARTRQYDLTYTERTSWAVSGLAGGDVSGDTLQYRGGAATVFGVGFAALGIMLLSWAAGLALSLIERAGIRTPAITVRLLAMVSLAGLAVGCVALFPPWRRHTMTLYLVVTALVLVVTLPIPFKIRKQALPALVVVMIAAGFVGFPAFPIFAGFFVALAAGTNLLILSPRMRAWAERLPADTE